MKLSERIASRKLPVFQSHRDKWAEEARSLEVNLVASRQRNDVLLEALNHLEANARKVISTYERVHLEDYSYMPRAIELLKAALVQVEFDKG